MSRDGKITVFLVDDHEVVRRGVHEMLSLEEDIEVVGEAGTAADALVRIPAAQPDVAVLDVRLPDGSGVEVCREIRSGDAGIKCLMLTSYSDDEALFDAIMAGASGYVLKAIRGSELLSAVRDVAAGKSLLDPVATQRVLERLRDGSNQQDERLNNLTDQERRILDLIGEGLTNRAIGERLHLAEKTIKNYVSSLLAKLGMERRSQAAAYVARLQAGRPERQEPAHERPDRFGHAGAAAPTRPPAAPGQPGAAEPSSRPEPARPAEPSGGADAPGRPAPPEPEPARPEPAQPGPSGPEPARPEPARPEPARPEPSGPESSGRGDQTDHAASAEQDEQDEQDGPPTPPAAPRTGE